jgi:hypothetical protein
MRARVLGQDRDEEPARFTENDITRALSRIRGQLALYGRPRLEAMTTGLNRTVHIRLLANLRDKPNPDTLPIPRQLPRSQQTMRILQQLPLRPVANA